MAVDAGKHTTKALGKVAWGNEIKKVNFRTKMYDMANGDIELQGKSYKVKFDGYEYIVGEQGENVDNSNTKTSILHKISTYTAVTQLIKPDESSTVNMVLGCPSNIFKNKNLKEEYRDFIKGTNQIRINVNGENYNFDIGRVVINCEGSGIVYMLPELFRARKTAVIDLGGRNMNFAVYQNMVSMPSTIFSNSLGSTSLETDLKEQLQMYLGESVDMIDVEYALENGGLILSGKLDNKTAAIVQNCKRNYVKKVVQVIKEKGINLNTMSVLGIGGTSLTVESELKDEIKHIEVIKNPNAQTISVEGFYKVASVKFR